MERNLNIINQWGEEPRKSRARGGGQILKFQLWEAKGGGGGPNNFDSNLVGSNLGGNYVLAIFNLYDSSFLCLFKTIQADIYLNLIIIPFCLNHFATSLNCL